MAWRRADGMFFPGLSVTRGLDPRVHPLRKFFARGWFAASTPVFDGLCPAMTCLRFVKPNREIAALFTVAKTSPE
jgi:hypothetical protein